MCFRFDRHLLTLRASINFTYLLTHLLTYLVTCLIASGFVYIVQRHLKRNLAEICARGCRSVFTNLKIKLCLVAELYHIFLWGFYFEPPCVLYHRPTVSAQVDAGCRYVSNPEFEPSLVKNASKACEGICKWVRALDIYDRVIKVVAPKKMKLAEAEADLELQMNKLNEKRAELKKVRN